MPAEFSDQNPSGASKETRRQELIRELRERLGPACREWPAELFDSMVEGLADITLKYERSSATSFYDRRTTDRLVEDLRDALDRSEEARDRKPS